MSALLMQRSLSGGVRTWQQPRAHMCPALHTAMHKSPTPCRSPDFNKRQPKKLSLRATASASASTSEPGSPAEGYDVYVVEPEPLKAGEEKHVVSVFVADESGMINRVAGVFARRGANIESLAVGLTTDKALFTIVVTGTSNTVSNLVKQLAKLVKVRYVEDVTQSTRVERELMLLKLGVPAGPARTEVMQLCEIFRARVVDVSDRYLTVCVSGDPGKCLAMQKVMTKFGISELCRTGRISLKRGEAVLEGGAQWGRMAPPPAPERARPSKPAAAAPQPAQEADVYAVEGGDAQGVWDVDNILEGPGYSGTSQADPQGFAAHTLTIEVMDVPGVLNQVTGVFARRGYNVQSLAVGPCEKAGNSRITMVVPGSEAGIHSLIKQLNKLAFVQSTTDLSDSPFSARELMLIKVRCSSSQRGELRDLVEIFRGCVLDVSANTVTIEVQGKADKLKALYSMLEPYGIMEVARTGRIALIRESGVDSAYLERMSSGRVW